MNNYIEFSLYVPFFDIIDDTDESASLETLRKQLKLSFNTEELYQKYLSYGEYPDSTGKGDVFVFFNGEDKESFLFIDLFNGFTDQHSMVKIGVRCGINHGAEIKNILNQIWERVEIKSKIEEYYDDSLKREISPARYPKEIRYGHETYRTNIFFNAWS